MVVYSALIKLYHMVELQGIVKALPYGRARMLSSLALVFHEVKMLETLALTCGGVVMH